MKPNIKNTITNQEVYDPVSGREITVGMRADLTRDYTVSRSGVNSLSTLQSLANQFDDVTKEHGIDIYKRMMSDGEVSAAIGAFVEAASSTRLNVRSLIRDENDDEYESSEEITEFIRWVIDRLPRFAETQKSMIRDGLAYGTSVSSLRYGYVKSGRYKEALVVDEVVPNPLTATRLVVDVQSRIVGVIPHHTVGNRSGYSQGVVYASKSGVVEGVLPREKFAILTWNPESGDARGQSMLRPAFAAWWIKQKTIESMMQWSEKYAWPSLVGTTPDGAVDVCETDENGNEIVRQSATEALNQALLSFGNGSVLAVPHGTDISMLQVQGSAQSFLDIIAWCNTEIMRSIQNQHLATAEGIHQARAAADVHKDVLSLMIVTIKEWYCDMVRNDIIRPLVEANYPAFTHLIPTCDLGDGTGFRLSVADVASLAGVGWFTEEQMQEIDRQLGIPPR